MRPRLRPDRARNRGRVGKNSDHQTPLALSGTAFLLRGRRRLLAVRVLSIRWLRVRVPSASLDDKPLLCGGLCLFWPSVDPCRTSFLSSGKQKLRSCCDRSGSRGVPLVQRGHGRLAAGGPVPVAWHEPSGRGGKAIDRRRGRDGSPRGVRLISAGSEHARPGRGVVDRSVRRERRGRVDEGREGCVAGALGGGVGGFRRWGRREEEKSGRNRTRTCDLIHVTDAL